MSGDSTALKLKNLSGLRNVNEQLIIDDSATWITESIDETQDETKDTKVEIVSQNKTTVEISVHQETPTTPPAHGFLSTTIITTSSSVDTLNGESTGLNLLSGPSSPSNLSSITLVGSTGSGCAPNENDKDNGNQDERKFVYSQAPTSPLPERKRKPILQENNKNEINKIESIAETDTSKKVSECDDATKNVKIPETISFKPKIVSALTKTSAKDEGSRTASPYSTPTKSSNVLQPMSYLTMNRRPSAGTIGTIPVAALTEHRRSLQLNSSEFGIPKASFFSFEILAELIASTLRIFPIFFVFLSKFQFPIERGSPRSSRRASKTTEKIKKTLFGTPSKDNSR